MYTGSDTRVVKTTTASSMSDNQSTTERIQQLEAALKRAKRMLREYQKNSSSESDMDTTVPKSILSTPSKRKISKMSDPTDTSTDTLPRGRRMPSFGKETAYLREMRTDSRIGKSPEPGLSRRRLTSRTPERTTTTRDISDDTLSRTELERIHSPNVTVQTEVQN